LPRNSGRSVQEHSTSRDTRCEGTKYPWRPRVTEAEFRYATAQCSASGTWSPSRFVRLAAAVSDVTATRVEDGYVRLAPLLAPSMPVDVTPTAADELPAHGGNGKGKRAKARS
jgi:hypothetical protein